MKDSLGRSPGLLIEPEDGQSSGQDKGALVLDGEGGDGTACDQEPVCVEFVGWLPCFGFFGNCGNHPQFGHTESPPPGYRFTRSELKLEEAGPHRPRWRFLA